MPTVIRARRPRVEITSGGSGSGSGQLTFTEYKQSILDERKGYALFGNVTGGQSAATPTVVNTTANSGAGSLRTALTGGSNRWIVFDPAVFPPTTPTTITLASQIDMRNVNNITLDGFGSQVTIAGFGITTATWTGVAPWVSGTCNNLIFANLKVGPTSSGNFDCFTIDGTDRLWMYHVEASGGGDGNIDITLTGYGPSANGYMTLQNVYAHDSQVTKNCLFGDQTQLNTSVPATGYGDMASSTSSYPSANGGDNRISTFECRFKDAHRNPIKFNYWDHGVNNYYHGYTLEGPTVMGGNAAQYLEGCVIDGASGGANASKGMFAWTFGYADSTRKYKRMGQGTGARANVYKNGAAFTDGSGGFLNPAGTPFWLSIPYSYSVENAAADSGAALIARLASTSESTQGRAGRIIRDGYYARVLGA